MEELRSQEVPAEAGGAAGGGDAKADEEGDEDGRGIEGYGRIDWWYGLSGQRETIGARTIERRIVLREKVRVRARALVLLTQIAYSSLVLRGVDSLHLISVSLKQAGVHGISLYKHFFLPLLRSVTTLFFITREISSPPSRK